MLMTAYRKRAPAPKCTDKGDNSMTPTVVQNSRSRQLARGLV